MDTINLNQSGIYAITSPSGKRYVGSAVNLQRRWNRHRRLLGLGTHHCTGLQRAYNKYGDTLVYTVLILCPKEDLIKEEQRCMDMARGILYNSAPIAGSCLGVKHSDETKAKVAAATRARVGSMLGKKHSEEARARMAAAKRGKPRSAEAIAKIVAFRTGKPRSAETVAKMSAAQLGKAKKSNTSGFVGVSWDKRGRAWRSYSRLCGKSVHLGSYPAAELANQARQNFNRILEYYDHS